MALTDPLTLFHLRLSDRSTERGHRGMATVCLWNPDARQRHLRLDSLPVQKPPAGIISSAIAASNLIKARLPEFLSTCMLYDPAQWVHSGVKEVRARLAELLGKSKPAGSR